MNTSSQSKLLVKNDGKINSNKSNKRKNSKLSDSDYNPQSPNNNNNNNDIEEPRENRYCTVSTCKRLYRIIRRACRERTLAIRAYNNHVSDCKKNPPTSVNKKKQRASRHSISNTTLESDDNRYNSNNSSCSNLQNNEYITKENWIQCQKSLLENISQMFTNSNRTNTIPQSQIYGNNTMNVENPPVINNVINIPATPAKIISELPEFKVPKRRQTKKPQQTNQSTSMNNNNNYCKENENITINRIEKENTQSSIETNELIITQSSRDNIPYDSIQEITNQQSINSMYSNSMLLSPLIPFISERNQVNNNNNNISKTTENFTEEKLESKSQTTHNYNLRPIKQDKFLDEKSDSILEKKTTSNINLSNQELNNNNQNINENNLLNLEDYNPLINIDIAPPSNQDLEEYGKANKRNLDYTIRNELFKLIDSDALDYLAPKYEQILKEGLVVDIVTTIEIEGKSFQFQEIPVPSDGSCIYWAFLVFWNKTFLRNRMIQQMKYYIEFKNSKKKIGQKKLIETILLAAPATEEELEELTKFKVAVLAIIFTNRKFDPNTIYLFDQESEIDPQQEKKLYETYMKLTNWAPTLVFHAIATLLGREILVYKSDSITLNSTHESKQVVRTISPKLQGTTPISFTPAFLPKDTVPHRFKKQFNTPIRVLETQKDYHYNALIPYDGRKLPSPPLIP